MQSQQNEQESVFVNYEDFSKGKGYPYVKDCCESGPYPNQREIADYLINGGEFLFWRLGYERDIFTRKWIAREVSIREAGGYCWASRLAWYVENYNLRLPADFEAFILTQIK